MSEGYFGPTRDARATLNDLLALPATGSEQDWEIELADPHKLGRMVELLDDEGLNVEERSALALLLLHTIDEMADGGMLTTETLSRVRWKLRSDAEILERMRFYWSRLEASTPVTMALN